MKTTDTTIHDIWCYHYDKQMFYKGEWKAFVNGRRLTRKQDKDLWRRLRRKAYHNYRRHENYANKLMEVYNGQFEDIQCD